MHVIPKLLFGIAIAILTFLCFRKHFLFKETTVLGITPLHKNIDLWISKYIYNRKYISIAFGIHKPMLKFNVSLWLYKKAFERLKKIVLEPAKLWPWYAYGYFYLGLEVLTGIILHCQTEVYYKVYELFIPMAIHNLQMS